MDAGSYYTSLSGWQSEVAAHLRSLITEAAPVTEVLKWGHPTYEASGPVCFVRAHKSHVTLSFWRGADLLEIEPRLERQGQFDMAAVKITQEREIADAVVQALVRRGVALNAEKGDPLKSSKPGKADRT